MLNEPSQGLLQVEINMIAASFGCLSALVTRMHKHTLAKTGRRSASLQQPRHGQVGEGRSPPQCHFFRCAGVLDPAMVADNGSLEGLASGIAAAHRAMDLPSGARVLMVVQPNERNAYDQQWLATELYAK